MYTFDALLDEVIRAHPEARIALGEVMVRYNADPQARLAVNRWLTQQLESEVERRSRP